MMLFFVEDEHGNDRFIFARGSRHAAELFVTWQMVNEAPMGGFVIERVTIRSRTPDAAAHLQDALLLNLDGVGSYNEVTGWSIRPIEDQRPIPDWV